MFHDMYKTGCFIDLFNAGRMPSPSSPSYPPSKPSL